MVGFFSYFNVDPNNIRNRAEIGGGALMDIGCYMVHGARYAFEAEPLRVTAAIDRDPVMKTDRLTSGMMEFAGGQAVFMCSTQLAPFQRISFFGTKGRITLDIPVNAPNDRPSRLAIDSGADLFGGRRVGGVVSGERPVHAAGRCVCAGGLRQHGGAGAGGGRGREYGGDRGSVPVGGDGKVGGAVQDPISNGKDCSRWAPGGF